MRTATPGGIPDETAMIRSPQPLLLGSLRVVAAAIAASGVARSQTGLVPLTQLGSGTHGGFAGGLYPGGQNVPPSQHLADALAKAGDIVPRDATGAPHPDGWIGMVALGMSNTTHEFGAFERMADTDTTRNARLVIMDTAFGGQTATVLANPAAPYWTTLAQRVTAMGLTAAQVQVAWLKEAEANPANDFPVHAQALRDTLKRVVQNLHDKYPNVKICYASSRVFGGYSAQGGLNPEPQAYESGFSVKWLIEDQIAGDPALNYGALAGDVRAPLLLWGPYLWADGTVPRADGLVWNLADFETDHVHPSASGEQKVADLLAAFFAADPTTQAWWPAQPGARLRVLDAIHDAHVALAAPGTNFGASPVLTAVAGTSAQNIYLRFDASAVDDPVLLAKLSLRVTTSGGAGGPARLVSDATWNESTITWSNAPALGATLASMPQVSRDGTWGANVTTALNADPDGQFAVAITSPAMTPGPYHSKEGGQAPRLVLSVATPTVAAGRPGAAGDAMRLRSWPNPASAHGVLAWAQPTEAEVDLTIFALDGRRVRTLAHGPRAAGAHEERWDGRDATGHRVAPGVYIARLTAARRVSSVRIAWIR